MPADVRSAWRSTGQTFKVSQHLQHSLKSRNIQHHQGQQHHTVKQVPSSCRQASQHAVQQSTDLQDWQIRFQMGLKHLAASTAAALVICWNCPEPANAQNVRVEDVENPMMQSGLMAANEGKFTEAESYFKIVLKSDEESASAWSNLGNVHLSLGRAKDAAAEFTKAISLAPDAPVPYLNRALAREALGVEASIGGQSDQANDLYRDALQDCRGATQRDPKEFAAWFNKGNIELRLGLFHEALDSYTKAADLAPGISGYRLREAELMFQEGKTDQSDRIMRGVVRKNPYYAEAHAALAAVEWASGKCGSAEDHFNAATQIEPGWMSMSYIKTNTRWPPALYEAMQRFLSMAPLSAN